MSARQLSGTGYGRFAGSVFGQDVGTFAVWIYKNSNTVWQTLCDADSVRYLFSFSDATHLYVYNDGRETTATVSVTNSVWTHVAVRYNKTGNVQQVFINGVLASAGAGSGTWGGATLSTYAWLGCKTTNGEIFDGAMAFPGFWDTALSDGDIASLAAGATPSSISAVSFSESWNFTGADPEVGANSGNMTMLGTSTIITGPVFSGLSKLITEHLSQGAF